MPSEISNKIVLKLLTYLRFSPAWLHCCRFMWSTGWLERFHAKGKQAPPILANNRCFLVSFPRRISCFLASVWLH